MSRRGPSRYIVCYDVADPRRLARIHRRIKRDGVALQKSVFDCQLDKRRLGNLIRDVRELMDDSVDDLRIYCPHLDAEIEWIGKLPMPSDIQLFNDETDNQR
jgi:CRISPR-associated protein Cas2